MAAKGRPWRMPCQKESAPGYKMAEYGGVLGEDWDSTRAQQGRTGGMEFSPCSEESYPICPFSCSPTRPVRFSRKLVGGN